MATAHSRSAARLMLAPAVFLLLVWMLPLEPGSPELQRMTRTVEEALAKERARYDAAKAGG
jgi:hypothetical protein